MTCEIFCPQIFQNMSYQSTSLCAASTILSGNNQSHKTDILLPIGSEKSEHIINAKQGNICMIALTVIVIVIEIYFKIR